MKRISNAELRQQFIGWQCRLRQISARDYGGQPLNGMRPRVVARSGEEIVPAMTVLLIRKAPEESTTYLKFQTLRTNEPKGAYDAGLRFLAGDYYQEPELFRDEMAALFSPGSEVARALVAMKECLLDFEQFSQRYTMFCAVRRVPARDAMRQATLWHNRIFNPDVPEDSTVLAFKPNWANAHAEPMPGGQSTS